MVKGPTTSYSAFKKPKLDDLFLRKKISTKDPLYICSLGKDSPFSKKTVENISEDPSQGKKLRMRRSTTQVFTNFRPKTPKAVDEDLINEEINQEAKQKLQSGIMEIVHTYPSICQKKPKNQVQTTRHINNKSFNFNTSKSIMLPSLCSQIFQRSELDDRV